VVVSGGLVLRRARAAEEDGRISTVLAREALERKRRDQAIGIVSSLATTVDSLARLQAAGTSEPETVPPSATEFSSPTACMLSYLPEVSVQSGSLDFVCEQTDAWTLEWKVRAQLSGKVGEGARLWSRLGPYALAALASMRKGCCVDPPYLQAKVPGLWCGVLRDTLRDVQAVPTRQNVRGFETMMKCLERRGMHLPDHFSDGEPERAERAFAELLRVARHRKAGAPAVSTR
jgi:hypothetical protein